MFVRTGSLVILLYVTVGIVLAAFATIMFSYYESRPLASHITPALAFREKSGSARAHWALQPAAAENVVTRERTRQMRDELQLARKLLKRRTDLLALKTAECELLRKQLKSTPRGAGAAEETPDGQTPQQEAELQLELARLQFEIAESNLEASEQAQQVESLQADLLQAELEMSMMQDTADLEIGNLLDQSQLFESTARQALVRLGAAAVPVLIESLAAERADIREWSAKVLGEIGPEAAEARPDLMALLTDPSQPVRRQARQALSQIED